MNIAPTKRLIVCSLTLLSLNVVSAAALARPLNPTGSQPAATQSTHDIRVDYFGSEKGYAVGSGSVTMLCVLRNNGRNALNANTLRVRCYTLSGFDYTEGELTPLVPALAPGQSTAFRWKLQPTDKTTALVASVLLLKAVNKSVPDLKSATSLSEVGSEEQPYLPSATLAVVPRLAISVPDVASPFTLPSAATTGGSVRIGNDKVLFRVLPANSGSAIGALYAKTANGWVNTSVAFPFVQIRSSAEGQTPWWRTFKWKSSESQPLPGGASLTIYGSCGDDWDVQVTFETHKDSTSIDGKIRLKAHRTSRLFSVQLPRFISPVEHARPTPSSDGTSVIISANPAQDGLDSIAAAHTSLVTSGLAWPSKSSLNDWIAVQLPQGDTDHTVQLGVQWSGGDKGEVFLPGGIVEFTFKIFAVSPSDTVRDAHRFAMP